MYCLTHLRTLCESFAQQFGLGLHLGVSAKIWGLVLRGRDATGENFINGLGVFRRG